MMRLSTVEAERWRLWKICERDGHQWGSEFKHSYRTVRACERCGAETDGLTLMWNVRVNDSLLAVKP